MTNVNGQRLEIQDLSNSYGLLPIKLGPARVIQTYKSLIHIVKLENYQNSIEKIKASIDILDNKDEFEDMIGITKIKFKELEQKMHTLLPNYRTKRGIVNAAGTLIKAITGNMDAEDALQINKQIESIKFNQYGITDEVNQLVQMNNQMSERFNNITLHINNQQETIEAYLNLYNKQIGNKIRTEEESLKYLQYINRINFNIDLLHNHLTNIAEAIVLARLSIISKQILNPTELSEIYRTFQDQKIKIESDQQIYEFLNLKAYYNSSNIIFSVQIPMVSNNTYSLFHLIPLPINKTLTVITKPYAILNELDIKYFDEACPFIEGVFYCREIINTPEVNEPTCIPNIIKNKPASCKLLEGNQISTIYQPEPNYVLTINIPNTTLKSSCNIPQSHLEGTMLIHFENCSIEINEISYDSKSSVYWDDITIYPSMLQQINSSKTIEDLNLEKLNTYQFKNLQAIKLLQTNISHKDNITYGTIAFIGIATTIFIIRKLKKSTQPNPEIQPRVIFPKEPTSSFAPEVSRIQLFWPSLHSKGGGVTVQTQTDSSQA